VLRFAFLSVARSVINQLNRRSISVSLLSDSFFHIVWLIVGVLDFSLLDLQVLPSQPWITSQGNFYCWLRLTITSWFAFTEFAYEVSFFNFFWHILFPALSFW
jgi:hypothetical protein